MNEWLIRKSYEDGDDDDDPSPLRQRMRSKCTVKTLHLPHLWYCIFRFSKDGCMASDRGQFEATLSHGQVKHTLSLKSKRCESNNIDTISGSTLWWYFVDYPSPPPPTFFSILLLSFSRWVAKSNNCTSCEWFNWINMFLRLLMFTRLFPDSLAYRSTCFFW